MLSLRVQTAQSIKDAARRWLVRYPALFERTRLLLRLRSEELMVLRRVVRRGDTVLDIGANVGQFTFPLCHMVGREGAVHAFEPVPATFLALSEAARRSRVPGALYLNNCAVSDREGITSMLVPSGDVTQASLARHALASWSDGLEDNVVVHAGVPSRTLDGYLEEKSVGRVAVVKCDVEGAELLVLRGASRLLSTSNRPILLLEVFEGWTRDFGYSPQELFAFLSDTAGYVFYHLGQAGLRPVHWKQEVPARFPDHLNFLCVVPDIHGARLSCVLGSRRSTVA